MCASLLEKMMKYYFEKKTFHFSTIHSFKNSIMHTIPHQWLHKTPQLYSDLWHMRPCPLDTPTTLHPMKAREMYHVAYSNRFSKLEICNKNKNNGVLTELAVQVELQD